MGGVSDIWKKSGSKIGIEVINFENKYLIDDNKNLEQKLINIEQKFNDMKLEFFTFSHTLSAGIEKIAPGQAQKVYHGPGPIIINFKDTPERV